MLRIRHGCLILSFILTTAGISRAATPLSDTLAMDTLFRENGPYIVEKDIIIPKGKKIVVAAGCVFLFKQYTGVRSYGSFVVNGDAEHPVVFTSILDVSHDTAAAQKNHADTLRAAPFDWNGIDILDGATGTRICNAYIRYTVNGINSRTQDLTISGCYFNASGQYDVIIQGKIFNVTQGTPFSYSPPLPSIGRQPLVVTIRDYKKQLRIGTLAFGALGLLTGAGFSIAAAYQRSVVEDMEWGPVGEGVLDPEAVDAAKQTYRDYRTGYIVGYSLGGVGLGGFALTFVIKKNGTVSLGI